MATELSARAVATQPREKKAKKESRNNFSAMHSTPTRMRPADVWMLLLPVDQGIDEFQLRQQWVGGQRNSSKRHDDLTVILSFGCQRPNFLTSFLPDMLRVLSVPTQWQALVQSTASGSGMLFLIRDCIVKPPEEVMWIAPIVPSSTLIRPHRCRHQGYRAILRDESPKSALVCPADEDIREIADGFLKATGKPLLNGFQRHD
ncbi:hypothetical protein I7I51_07993 [Histoplasma capsulatum]|uniref:Uncharacterized protein n=1 Tax=Ajellomyces capsulatus TaxID=5037 RepID=A0A8A1LWN6_AJECA|nr:hypothetical protein I7I51_07993 [Histoplasma capsulatum]